MIRSRWAEPAHCGRRCRHDAAPAGDGGATDGGPTDGGAVDGPRRVSGTFLLTLDAGAFPPTASHPSALVYLPSNFDPTPPIGVIVFLHGFNNCVENVVRDAGQSCDPAAGTPVREEHLSTAVRRELEKSRRPPTARPDRSER